jgi:pimeloyl-ACP methyl ester carboxylesterase
MPPLRHLTLPDGRRIAWRKGGGDGTGAKEPAVVFLPGYMSDMAGGKAGALMAWAQAQARTCVLLDYSGCGKSGGDFAAGTLSRWREEVLAVIAAAGVGRVVLVGSSMGGWLALLVALALAPERVAGLVGIAAAPDFTRWGFTPKQKAELVAGRTLFEPNAYGPEPTPTHPGFWADGEKQRLMGDVIALDCPVHLLHGQADAVVPWDLSLKLAARLRSDAVQVTLIKDGDHRLSRDGDIALLLGTVAALVAIG